MNLDRSTPHATFELKKIAHILTELETIYSSMIDSSVNINEFTIIDKKRPSAQNLVDYLTFRQFHLAELQEQLGTLGLSRFARAEGHIRYSLLLAQNLLSMMLGTNKRAFPLDGITIEESKACQAKNVARIFGTKLKEKRVRTMVTMPSELADDFSIAENLIANKMNCARINCAHDNAENWVRFVENLKKTAQQQGRQLQIAADLSGPKIRIDLLFKDGKLVKNGKKKHLLLQKNDQLFLLKSEAYYNPEEQRKVATCTLPEVLDMVKVNQRIFFDDGKIEGLIEEVKERFLIIRIVKTRIGGSKLKHEKGINFPDSELTLPGLSEKDKEDFKFVANYCDIVNLSFINSVQDLTDLYDLIDAYEAHHLAILLKIETKCAFNNLPEILLHSMGRKTLVGVMIARGDLAVEVGWDQIGYVQNEILRICNAAHVPVVWATQVLENLAKKGIPSRSEVTDISQALKADCVMLNKGPYIVEALQFLNKILIKDEAFQKKTDAMLPKLEAV